MGISTKTTQSLLFLSLPITPVVVLSLAAFVLLFQLGQSSLVDYDEGIYAVVSKEMFTSGDFLTLRFDSELWFEKPPLLFWITSLFYHLFGVSEFSARAPSAIAGVFVVFLIYLIAELIYKKRVAIIASLCLLANYEFLRVSRSGITDMLLTLFVFLSIYAYLRLKEQDCRWWYLIWFSFALAFLVKSWAALIIPAAIGIDISLSRNPLGSLQTKHFWFGSILALIIILPWPIIMYIFYGKEFIGRFIFYDLINRSMTALEGNSGDSLFYYFRLYNIYIPWLHLVPFAIVFSIRENLSKQSASRILLILVILVFGIYSLLINTKIQAYIFPIYPALSILISYLFFQAFTSHDFIAFGGVVYAMLITTLSVASKLPVLSQPLGLLAIFSLISFPLFKRLFSFISEKETTISGGKKSNSYSVYFKRIMYYARKVNIYQWAVISIYILILFVGMMKSIQLYQPSVSPIEKISSIAGQGDKHQHSLIGLALSDGDKVGILGPIARFYSNRPITIAWSMEELSDLMKEKEKAEILLLESYVDSLSKNYDLKIEAKVDPYIYATIQLGYLH